MHGHRTVLTGLLGAVLLVAALSSCTQGGD